MINRVSFAGQREDRNNVDKLRLQTNALNFNNQRNIKKSIENLSNDSSTKNVNFLMNVAEQIKYGLNAGVTDVKPNNDWMGQLRNAAKKGLENNNTADKEALEARFKNIFENNKDLSEQEKTLLSLRDSLLNTRGLKTKIKTSDNENVRNIKSNLNYFVVSSEINIDEKVQVLDKLNKFMSPEYKIDKQLKDKKPQVLGEMLNDLIVKRADQERPTIKQVDQRHHGMCAAISHARKLMAYEYKPQYVDIVMQEVSAADEMEVYDISELGSGKKTTIPKTYIDYNYAEEKGYRIIDASTLQWMNAAGTVGNGNDQATVFSAFDKKYFDTFHDGHYLKNFDDPVLAAKNNQLRGLAKADEQVNKTIKAFDKAAKSAMEQKLSEKQNVMLVAQANRILANHVSELMPNADEKTVRSTVNELTHLNDEAHKKAKSEFYIVDAEEDVTKKAKIAKFIESKNPSVDKNLLNEKIDGILDLYSLTTETLEYMNKEFEPKTQKSKMMKYYKPLYETAATQRTAIDLGLDAGKLQNEAKRLGLAENATKEEVLTAMENNGEIVKEEVLRSLQTKYNRIAKYAAVVEKAEVKGDNVNIKDLYDISDKEASALEVVKVNLKNIKEAVSAEKNVLSKEMEAPLAKLAEDSGFKSGHYWVSEGQSGLNTAQDIRNFAMMTGLRAYSEENLDDVAKFIKNSNHSGVSATNVYHNEHGWHAMYIADVAPVQVKNAKTGEMEVKDAIMHDNSWGLAEKKNNWIDSNGLERTDYACGRGGDTGYITNSLWQNGTLLDDFKNKVANIEGSKYRMMREAVIPTATTLASAKSEALMSKLLYGDTWAEERITKLEKAVKSGKVTPQDLNMMKLRAEATSKIYSLASKSNNEIYSKVRTEADWNKIDANEPAKMLMERVAIATALDSETIDNYVSKLSKPEELAKADKMLQAVAAKELASTIKNTPVDEFDLNNYQITHNKDGYGNNRLQLVKEWIDNKFDPADNADFIAKLYELKSMATKELESYIRHNSTNKDLGINRKSSYEILKDYKNLDPVVKSKVSHILNIDVLNSTIGMTKSGKSPMETYFMMKRSYGNLDVAEAIKPYVAKNVEMGYRPAFPNMSIFNEVNITEASNKILTMVGNTALAIKDLADEETKKATVKNLNIFLMSNVEAGVDKIHRNRVLGIANQYIAEVQANGMDSEKAKALANQFTKEFVRHSYAKKPEEMLDEYLMLTATGENPTLAKSLRKMIVAASHKANGADALYSVMDAVSKGYAHEMGKEMLNTKLELKNTVTGEKSVVKIADNADAYLYQISDNAENMIGDVALTATMFNSMALSEKIMESLNKAINLEKIVEIVKANPKQTMAYAQFLQNKLNFARALNLSKSPAAQQIRLNFFQRCFKVIQQMPGVAIQTAKVAR